ncbi:hypothetical protein B484DRAFT_458601 [Ochromonadaceae sp. CCMP2298]|nr:hypothetical protein B484DRAFT_458601 [Ochromonadaceae sp. CCMP2298]
MRSASLVIVALWTLCVQGSIMINSMPSSSALAAATVGEHNGLLDKETNSADTHKTDFYDGILYEDSNDDFLIDYSTHNPSDDPVPAAANDDGNSTAAASSSSGRSSSRRRVKIIVGVLVVVAFIMLLVVLLACVGSCRSCKSSAGPSNHTTYTQANVTTTYTHAHASAPPPPMYAQATSTEHGSPRSHPRPTSWVAAVAVCYVSQPSHPPSYDAYMEEEV